MYVFKFNEDYKEQSVAITKVFAKVISKLSEKKAVSDIVKSLGTSYVNLIAKMSGKISDRKVARLKDSLNTLTWLNRLGYATTFTTDRGRVFSLIDGEDDIRKEVQLILKRDPRTQWQKAETYGLDQGTISLLQKNSNNTNGKPISILVALSIIHQAGFPLTITISKKPTAKKVTA